MRPREYEENSRKHLGARFDKETIERFDALCRSFGMSRTQALQYIILQTIQSGRIPVLSKDVLNEVAPVHRPTLTGGHANSVQGKVDQVSEVHQA